MRKEMTNMFKNVAYKWAMLLMSSTICLIGCKTSTIVPPFPKLEATDDVCTRMKDAYFKAYCYKNFDSNNDGKVSVDEAKAVTEITLNVGNDFTGIEYFSNLESFSLSSPASVKFLDLRYNTNLKNALFSGCTSLQTCLLPEGLEEIEPYTFAECRNLQYVLIPNSVRRIERSAFKNCTDLTSISIPEGVTHIGESAFLNCINLTSISIPESVTNIGEWAFEYCDRLVSIVLPKNLEFIGVSALPNRIYTVAISAEIPPKLYSGYHILSGGKYATLYVPWESIEIYKLNSGWGEFGKILPLPIDYEVEELIKVREKEFARIRRRNRW